MHDVRQAIQHGMIGVARGVRSNHPPGSKQKIKFFVHVYCIIALASLEKQSLTCKLGWMQLVLEEVQVSSGPRTLK